MKRGICVLLSYIMLCTMPTAHAVGTGASAAILMDADSGRVLYEENIHQRRLIASITKLMTALVAVESGADLQQSVAVKPEWTGIEGSSIYLQPGESVTLELLLYGMLLRSGNDAATAVAHVCAGSEEAFVKQMNEKARQLGMNNSSFANPSGLNAEGHYSTAYDMALLARACLKNDTVAQMVSTKSITLGNRMFTNHNKLLWRYDGCIGLKTGYTEKAGRTLISAAERDGLTLICVTLNDPGDWNDHTALFDYGFEGFSPKLLCRAGETLCLLPVKGSLLPVASAGVTRDYTVALAEHEQIERRIQLDCTSLEAPLTAGDRVGTVIWTLDGKELARAHLVLIDHIENNEAPGRNVFDRLRAVLD